MLLVLLGCKGPESLSDKQQPPGATIVKPAGPITQVYAGQPNRVKAGTTVEFQIASTPSLGEGWAAPKISAADVLDYLGKTSGGDLSAPPGYGGPGHIDESFYFRSKAPGSCRVEFAPLRGKQFGPAISFDLEVTP